MCKLLNNSSLLKYKISNRILFGKNSLIIDVSNKTPHAKLVYLNSNN